MSKRTYLIVWTLIFALVLGMTGVANAVALYWDSALTIFFGEIGGVESAEGKDDTGSIYFPSDYSSSEERIAASEEISKTIVAEGTVLLKNHNNVLPLKSGAKVSIFGIDAKDGSLGKAMEAAGYTVNPTLAEFYAASSHSSGAGSLSAGNGAETGGWVIDEVPQSEYTAEVKSSYAQYADAAIVLLMRTGAEGNDLPYDMSRYGGSADEHYLELNQDEKDLLAAVGAEFETVIVLIDSANAMQVDFVDQEEYGSDACLWHARCPYTSIVGIISGSINPSGRLVDTYVADNMSSPAMQNFGDFRYVDESGNLIGQSYINYAEGIYVGYKYYETRYEDVVMGRFNAGDYSYADTVVYPFGYGLSYTSFEWSDFTVTENSGTYTASVTVKNTGSMAGKDVVEFYIQSPYIEGGVEKAAVSLVEYAKTKTLEPGETQTVTVTFTQQDIASYDYKNERTYVLDAGDYYITAAKDAHDAINNVLSAKGYSVENGMTADGNTGLVHKFTLAEKKLMNVAVTGVTITNKLDETLAENCEYLSRSDWSKMENRGLRYATGMIAGVSNVGNASGDAPTYVASAELMANFALKGFAASGNPNDPSDTSVYPNVDSYTYGAENRIELIDMKGLAYDDPKWEDLLDELKLSEMHALFNKSGWGNAAVESINKPKTYEYDAPNGIANFVTGEILYSYPCATMLAATWNQELQEDYGVMIGNDAIATNTSGWYAPGINIHRTPFGARNYEYYSEDGVLTGLCSTAVTRGAESKGIHVYLKHFALNDQDTNRHANGGVTTWATEQAIREIYLKPFQMSIEDGGARGIMLTMSRVGWRYSCGSYPLMTAICRDEWGFTGCYITDYTTSMKGSGSDQYLAAGGNLVHATAEQTLSDVKSNWCRAEIREAVHGIPALSSCAAVGDYSINEVPWPVIEKEAGLIDTFASYGDAAIFVLARSGGEGLDLATDDCLDEGTNGDYLSLSKDEKETLVQLKALKDSGVFKKLIVLMNSSNALNCAFLEDPQYGIDACLWIGGVGAYGNNAVANILLGITNPSGRLVDTYLYDNFQNPSMYNFASCTYPNAAEMGLTETNDDHQTNVNYLVYQEGIYVGYKYYETRYEDQVMGTGNAGSVNEFNYGDQVYRTFGFGMSYDTQPEYNVPQPNYRFPEYNIYYCAADKQDTGWTAPFYDDSSWSPAQERGSYGDAPWNALHLRPIPLLKEFGLTDYLNSAEYVDYTTTAEESITMQLPYNAQITPYLEVSSDGEAVITIITDNTVSCQSVYTTYVTSGDGRESFESPAWISGQYITYIVPAGVTIHRLAYRESGYDTDMAGTFSMNDEFFDTLWQMGARTQYLCIRENFMDCPDRERAQWTGDATSQMRQMMYCLDTSAYGLYQKMMSQKAAWVVTGENKNKLNDFLPTVMPIYTGYYELPAQEMAGIVGIWDYYTYTGDASVLHTMYQPSLNYLQKWKTNTNGLVKHKTGQGLVDWQDTGANKVDTKVSENAWYYWALSTVRKMALALGEDTTWLDETMTALYDGYQTLWVDGVGYATGATADDRGNALAVLSGLASEDKYETISQVLKTSRMASSYMEVYVLQAMCEMGYISEALDRLRERYEPMVQTNISEGYTTLWEYYEAGQGTKNHAWSASPVYLLSKYVGGLRPTAPGYKKYEIVPDFSHSGTVAMSTETVLGTICMDAVLDQTANTCTMKLHLPEGGTAIVAVPCMDHARYPLDCGCGHSGCAAVYVLYHMAACIAVRAADCSVISKTNRLYYNSYHSQSPTPSFDWGRGFLKGWI